MEKQKTKTTTTAACGGGEDFFIEILVRLPVVSLLRFKSVCKSWRGLIQTSFFNDLHTTTTFNSSSEFGSFILVVEHGPQSMVSEILMLSSGSESEYSDWYLDTAGTGHKFTGGGWHWDNNGRWHGDNSGGGGSVWLWDNTDCGWYWGPDGTWHKFTDGGGTWYKFTGGGGGGGDWHWDNTNCGWYWVVSGDDDEVEEDNVELRLDYLELPPSSYDKLSYWEVVAGSCNGLICLHDSKLGDVSLWNPATRQFRILPKSITIQEEVYDWVAFGFDVKTKDYKVLMISCFTQGLSGCVCRVQVYSLSTDSWRLLEGSINYLPGIRMLKRHGLYMNGSCFFVGIKITSELLPSNNNNSLMFSFDFTKEIFTTMQFPDHDDRYSFVLSHLGKKLALFTAKSSSGLVEQGPPSSSSSYGDYDIWVWNEHGASSVNKEESWTKLHSFRIKNYRGANRWYGGDSGANRWTTIPRGISNNGEFAFIETRCTNGSKSKMQLFNLVTKEAKMDFLICDSVGRTDVYQQSLVSIIGGAASRR